MSYGDGSDEYQQAITDLNDSFRAGIRAFAKWAAENWRIDDADAQEQGHPKEYQRGWNAGMEGVDAAADSFLEEYHQ